MSNRPARREPRVASYQLALLAVLEAADLVASSNTPTHEAVAAETGGATGVVMPRARTTVP